MINYHFTIGQLLRSIFDEKSIEKMYRHKEKQLLSTCIFKTFIDNLKKYHHLFIRRKKTVPVV